ncbi:MAG: arylsulfatase [Verrucomicrobia bacterium]|nr:arylsulfatase [Verrucomicrobiota bacterium]
MKTRSCRRFGLGLLALLGSAGSSAGLAAAAPRPNIVVIYTDDQGYGDMSRLNPQARFATPHLDRIAHEGILFTDGHCADTVCTPSRYALLTGRYSWRTTLKSGVLHAEGDCLIARGRPTVASLLRAAGYRTAMFGKWHLNMKFPGTVGHRDWSQPITDGPTEHGFDEYFGIPASMNYGVLTFIENNRVTDPPSRWTHRKQVPEHHTFRFLPPYDLTRQNADDIEIAPSFRDDICLRVCTEKAVDYIARHAAEARAGRPFFLYLALNSPHLPHCAAPEFAGRSQVGAYGDFMLETDFRVGQVLAALDHHGLTRDTLVFQSSDNGPENGYAERARAYGHASNGELKGGKRDIYEGGHRVPFVMRWPAVIRAGRVCTEPVGQVDLFATCADIVGTTLPANAGEDSFSLLPALRGDDFARPLRGPLIHHAASGYFAIREGPWKLNLFRGSGGSLAPRFLVPPPGEPPFELYDMKDDWRETRNLCDRHPEVVELLKAKATAIVTNGRSTPGPAQPNDGPALWPELTWIPEAAQLASPSAAKAAKKKKAK